MIDAETFEIVAPQLGEGVREVRIIGILKKTGQVVSRDEVIVEVESEKSTVEIESPAAGKIGLWHCCVGDTVLVGTLLTSITSIVRNESGLNDRAG